VEWRVLEEMRRNLVARHITEASTAVRERHARCGAVVGVRGVAEDLHRGDPAVVLGDVVRVLLLSSDPDSPAPLGGSVPATNGIGPPVR
jgi:hypothetical protein